MIPFLFGAFCHGGRGSPLPAPWWKCGRQFHEIAGIMEGTGKPQYDKAVDLLTRAAIKKMIIPAAAAGDPGAGRPVARAAALGGLLMGSDRRGLFVAISMCTGGGAWDNARVHRGRPPRRQGQRCPQAAGDGRHRRRSHKDTAGPAVNPLIKIINIVALLLIPLLVGHTRRGLRPAVP